MAASYPMTGLDIAQDMSYTTITVAYVGDDGKVHTQVFRGNVGQMTWSQEKEKDMSDATQTSWGYELIVPEKSHLDDDGKKVVDRKKKVVAFVAGGLENLPSRKEVIDENAEKLAAAGISLGNVEEVVYNTKPFRG